MYTIESSDSVVDLADGDSSESEESEEHNVHFRGDTLFGNQYEAVLSSKVVFLQFIDFRTSNM